MKKTNKAQHQKLYEDALQFIVESGAKNRHIGEIASHYQIETKVGLLFITFEPDDDSKVFSIYTRFEDVKKAKAFLGVNERLNPYSGKFNFHSFEPNYLLTDFKQTLKQILN